MKESFSYRVVNLLWMRQKICKRWIKFLISLGGWLTVIQELFRDLFSLLGKIRSWFLTCCPYWIFKYHFFLFQIQNNSNIIIMHLILFSSSSNHSFFREQKMKRRKKLYFIEQLVIAWLQTENMTERSKPPDSWNLFIPKTMLIKNFRNYTTNKKI